MIVLLSCILNTSIYFISGVVSKQKVKRETDETTFGFGGEATFLS